MKKIIKNILPFFMGGRVNLLYLAVAGKTRTLKVSSGTDGFFFKTTSIKPIFKTKSGKEESMEKCENFHLSEDHKKKILFYEKRSGRSSKYYLATSSNMVKWRVEHAVQGITAAGAIVPNYRYDDDYLMYTGKKNLHVAFSRDMKKWRKEKEVAMKPGARSFDSAGIMPLAAFNKAEGIALIYFAYDKRKRASVGCALFNKDNPEQLIWRAKRPLWRQDKKETIKPVGVVNICDHVVFYYEDKAGDLMAVALPFFWYSEKIRSRQPVTLKRAKQNPIIAPRDDNAWESLATFNPTAFEYGGKVYIIYRAMGQDNVSLFGCATSRDGIHVDERYEEPVYVMREAFEGARVCLGPDGAREFMSGGGWGGCEDPKVALIGNTLYLTYVAFNGQTEPRVAISSIDIKDFLARNWEAWKRPVLISPPGVIDKSAVLLPEKVNGKYVVFHRVFPNVLIDYVDHLNFDGNTFLTGQHKISPRPLSWDSRKLSIAAAPIRIKQGWLTIYHAVADQQAYHYKIGAMILDAKDPAKVLYRSNEPVLAPKEEYENGGHKSGIVYPGGAVVKDGTLFVYYGGADKFSCVSYAPLEEFVEKLIANNTPRLHKTSILHYPLKQKNVHSETVS